MKHDKKIQNNIILNFTVIQHYNDEKKKYKIYHDERTKNSSVHEWTDKMG